MKTRINLVLMLALAIALLGAALTMATPAGEAPPRPKGPCDIYAAAGDPCVAAHSTTRALYASYNGPLYQVLRQSDGKTLNIGVVQPVAAPLPDAGGYANAAAQDAFCANTYCWIATIYDQSPKHNDLTQAPRGGFSGPAMGGFNNLPVADMAPITILGHKAYGVFIAPGMGLREDDAKGTAVDDQAEGQYWVVNGQHYNSGCCFDYGNAEIDSRDDDNGTMETTYYGNATNWYHGNAPGPWIMTDQENNLVGCVNPDGSKLCPSLPNITWRFVTAMAKGEPHHWTSMGGDAQKGALSVMFDGPRVNSTYDPMRKQGAILLGNGGDNSVGSQGTFYEGAMTAAGTFPTDATDQLVQANVVAARYDVPRLSLAPASATAVPPGLQTFSPASSQDTTVTFTNTTGAPAVGVKLTISVPNRQWTSVVPATTKTSETIADPVAPGASVSATFKVTSGPAAFNGDLVGNASWTNQTTGKTQSETTAEKVRNVSPIKINEFRVGSPGNPTNSFIELYNAGARDVDLSNWTLTEHSNQQAIFSAVQIPAGTKLPARGFYLLGLSTSGLAAPTRAGDTTIHVRSTTGLSPGDTIAIDAGSNVETRKIVSVGTAAGNNTTLWQPLPDGPVMKIPAGSTNLPVTSVAGFVVGEKIAIGHDATYPAVAKDRERYEVATVTAVGKPGTQAFLGADAAAGATNVKVTSVANISAGDKIRLDIDSVGHGIETVTVTRVGTQSNRAALSADASAGATNIKVRAGRGGGAQGGVPFAVGDKIVVGTPANRETVTITAVGASGPAGAGIDFTPALAKAHPNGEAVVDPGTGLDLAAPLRFNHAANLPFSARGTGISFAPETGFAHSSNEPVQPLGTGIKLDSPLAKAHAIDAVVRDAVVTTAGYQGTPAPNQWFGGPALLPGSGSMVLRDAAGLAVDSLNYGLLVDPWAGEGYQATSGAGQSGCRVTSPGQAGGFGPAAAAPAIDRSAGRFPDGLDTDSNCTDFVLQPATILSAASAAGTTNIKVASVADFAAGQTITIDTGANVESAVIATVGTAGATTVGAGTSVGATVIPVASSIGFSVGQSIAIDSGANRETAVVASTTGGRGGATITVAQLTLAHGRGPGIRHRYHAHRRIDQGACRRRAGRQRCSYARCPQPVFQERSLRAPVELNWTATARTAANRQVRDQQARFLGAATRIDMLSQVHSNKLLALAGTLALAGMIATVEAQPPATQPPAGAAAGRGGRGGGGGRGSRFKVYPQDAITRGLPAYNSTCGYCHGERGKGGKAGPDLIASLVTLHDEDGVQFAEFVRGAQHSKVVKIDASDSQIADIAAYLHSRVIYASGRGQVRVSEALVGDSKAGEQYFNGAGGCNKCHSPGGDLKGVGGKYDPPTLQERLVMPRAGRGGPSRGTGTAATLTLPSGETIKGTSLLLTDFYVTLRLADGSTRTWARDHGVPKVEVADPLQAHIDIMTRLSDTDMHNLTAYLATLK